MPEKRSRYEFTFMAEPMATGTFTRRHAPEGEVSSSLAEEVWRVPHWSSQETSTTAIMAVRGSVLIALILSLCICRNSKWFRAFGRGFAGRRVRYRRGCLVKSVARQKDAQAGVPASLEAVPSICHWRCVVAGAQGLRCSG